MTRKCGIMQADDMSIILAEDRPIFVFANRRLWHQEQTLFLQALCGDGGQSLIV